MSDRRVEQLLSEPYARYLFPLSLVTFSAGYILAREPGSYFLGYMLALLTCFISYEVLAK